jgi:hypothetical protein
MPSSSRGSNAIKLFHETKDHKCNYYYFSVRSDDSILKSAMHNEKDRTYNSIKDHVPNIREMLEHNGENLCAGVSKGYILEAFDQCKYVLVLTEIKKPIYSLRKETFVDSLCGLVFMKENVPKDTSLLTDYLYLNLICAVKGVGSHLLKKCEEIALKIGKTKVKLDSLDSPLGFYLYKGYRFDKSTSPGAQYQFSKDTETKEPTKDNKNLKYVDIKDIPEPKLGFVLAQKPNKNTYKWIVVNGDNGYEYRYIKPGNLLTHKRIETTNSDGTIKVEYIPIYDQKVMKYLKKFKRPELQDSGQTDINGDKINTNGGLIDTLYGVSTYRMDGEGVAMTKNLVQETASSSLSAQGKKIKKKKSTKKQKKLRKGKKNSKKKKKK